MKITILTVLKTGPEWLTDYVVKLKKAIDQNITVDYEFICLCDQEIPGVKTIPLLPCDAWGVWSKPQLFRRELGFTENCLYIDLDTIIVGSLDQFVKDCLPHKFLMSHCPWKGPISCSALMWWNGDYSFLWDQFLERPVAEWHTMYQSAEKYVDQGFISDRTEHELFQDVLPNPDYVGRVTKKAGKGTHSFLFCSGRRKPWNNLDHPDVKKYWDL